jgi:preprotein translocase subunit SecG
MWYSYMLMALALVPVVFVMKEKEGDLATTFGVLAALTQALGLARWVFVVPVLAQSYLGNEAGSASRDAIVAVFTALHQYAGVAIGEHLGQATTAAWAAMTAHRQLRGHSGGRHRWIGVVGLASALVLVLGLTEGFSTVVPFDPGLFGVLTPLGFVLLSIWLALTGVSLLQSPEPAAGPVG